MRMAADHVSDVIATPACSSRSSQHPLTVLSCVSSTREAAMRALRGVIVLVLALALSVPVLAADFQAGLEAYNTKSR